MRFETISANELDFYINNNNYLIVDLREEEDYVKSHITGAIYMDYDLIESNSIELPSNKIIILYCDRGGLSLMAAKKMSVMGYRTISVVGGFNSYHGKNLT
ncbi:rhodanese-related sulfurtransferase [Lachnotalea glycerini]|jgi:thiosulfate sulfurtransferase|uniref:Rhodanese-like domain-containing protein n=1 Tax=Lachnotalea glycerini TaxID=1763509 RepID=A0A255IKF0_9FIRM|nr:rhodanese-like domain-containing protein [Lachnotalea glycerini]PXV85141.1 rhodanese-related sulfurtransferase [Lachnotalea glycerini]RDY31947.1 rhodanese-like domain-containing protein [Lachnotalea glycerini]